MRGNAEPEIYVKIRGANIHESFAGPRGPPELCAMGAWPDTEDSLRLSSDNQSES
jgi:hypothetical protein